MVCPLSESYKLKCTTLMYMPHRSVFGNRLGQTATERSREAYHAALTVSEQDTSMFEQRPNSVGRARDIGVWKVDCTRENGLP